METIGHSVRASIDFNGPLNALATSPNKKLIAVGGRDVLKIVALEATGFTERRNLRAGKSNLNFSTNDIRWHPQSDSLLATAATNGAVVIWNLQRDGFKHVQERVLSGHRRAVNRICWHPTDGTLLLSGSQDGTIKLWDTRGKVSNTYQPKSESVRDVRVSAFQPNRFAAAFENGIVQIWDIRKNTQPELKFQAHKGLVLALDWHPGKPHLLASGGRDRYVKIWDLGDVSKPRQTIQTIASVGRVAWRPANADHIATSASLTDNRIHVWDVQHPWIPIASMKGHTDVASGIEWMDTLASATIGQPSDATSNGSGSGSGGGTEWEGLEYWQHMLACSKDGTLRLHSLADAFKPHQSLPTTALALNSRGQVAFSHDYIDRSCASLKIHRHTNLVSSLFTVTDATTAIQKFTNSPYSSSFNADTMNDDDAVGGASAQRMANRQISGGSATGGGGGGATLQPPPLAPRSGSSLHLHQSYPANGNVNAPGGGGGGIVRYGPHTQSMHSMSMQSIEGSGVDASGRRFVYPSGTSSAASSTTSSPNPSFFGSAAAPTPHAIVALVSMQNVNKADELEEIFHGDDSAFWAAQDRLELMQQHFEHVALLKDAFGFDEEVFRFLATHYVFVDDHMGFSELCAHNALAAFVAGNTHLSQMWRILDVLYSGTTSSSTMSASSPSNLPAEQGPLSQRFPENSRAGPLDHHHFVDSNDAFGVHDHHHHTHPGHHNALFANNNLEDSQHSRHNFENDEFSSTTSSMVVMGAAQSVVGGNPRAAGTTHTAMLLEQLDHVNPQAMQGFDPYPYDAHNAGHTQDVGNALSITDKEHTRPGAGTAGGHNSFSNGVQYRSNNTKSLSAIVHGSAVHGELSHVRDAMLKDLLEYYVDLGDLQTAVAVAFVTSKVANVEDAMGKSWLQQIYMHYIELLHQLRMYQVANELILHCSDASIRQMNQRSTTVYFNCANCSKPCETMLSSDGEPVNPYLCTNCNNPTTRCSICQLPVRGLYVWCPVCSHGGHLEHLADWFRDEDVCPTGCSHRCSFNFSEVRSIWSA